MKKFFLCAALLLLGVGGIFAQDCLIFVNGRSVHKNSKIKLTFDARFNEMFTVNIEPCGDVKNFEFEWTNLGDHVIGTGPSISLPVGKLMTETTIWVLVSKIDAYFVQKIEIQIIKKGPKKVRVVYD